MAGDQLVEHSARLSVDQQHRPELLRVRLAEALEAKTREQAETLEEQAATNHILEIISQSPTDVEPVLDAICEAAARVCNTNDVVVRLFEGEGPDLASRAVAHTGPVTVNAPAANTNCEAMLAAATTRVRSTAWKVHFSDRA